MSELIQWPRAKYWDRAWNPVIGCRPVSPACENCWAREWAGRFGKSFEPRATKAGNPPQRGVVFCGNMTDLWGEWTTPEMRVSWLNKARGNAVYLWLTKRRRTFGMDFLENRIPVVGENYFGFTAEEQVDYNNRYLSLLCKQWVSLEPLLGAIDLRFADLLNYGMRLPVWVVVGCESGPHRRPCKVEWVESIVEHCMSAGVPVFVKQLDIGGRCVTDIEKFPEHLRVRQVPWAGKE